MKKFIVLATLCLSSLVNATTSVPAAWAFNIANVQGSYFRATLDEANKLQSKYRFIPESKPGAGGAVAATYILSQDSKVALLGTAAGFFVRPNLYSTAGYSFEQFKPIHIMATAPAALVTAPGKELQDILSKNKISIGTAGAGSMTHLMALKFKEHFPTKDIELIPFKSSTEAVVNVLGGHIDLAYEFLGDAEAKQAKILGITGKTRIKNYPLLKDSGYPNQEDLVGIYLIMVKRDIPDEQYIEIQNILLEAEKSERVQELYRADYSGKVNLKTPRDYLSWYERTIKLFRELTAGQKVE
jgi:tripartite-type tricarboxylate transporter receptor subunit TctC